MAEKKVILKDGADELLPKTSASMVFTESGQTVEAALQNASVSKETIEQALTGNITTHRHDTTYNYTEFETDVWDGTSISTSLQGSGTKDDPYLIQSCADWLHLRANGASKYNIYQGNELGEATEFKPVFKLTKNLDFNNKEIPQAGTQEGIIACEFDGNGAKFSNFKDNQKIGILPNCNYAFAHDFVIEGFNAVYASSTENIPIFSRNDMYTTLLNNVVKGYTNINGSIDEDKLYVAFLQGLGYMAMSSTAILNTLTSYIEEHGNYLGIDLELNNNVVKNNGAKLTYALGCYLSINPVNIYCATELSDFELSDTGEAIFTEDSNCVFNMIASVQPSNFYTNSDGSNKIAIQSMEGENGTFTGTPKSLTEMKSASFVEELNSHLPKPAFRQDPDGGTPILAGGNATIAYDGYVKKSEFESFKKNINVEEPPAVIDSLSSESTTDALSANMGKKLNDEKVGSSEIRTIKKLTQSEYDGLSSKDSYTLYVIVG